MCGCTMDGDVIATCSLMLFNSVVKSRYLSQGSIDAHKIILVPKVLLYQVIQVWPVIPAQLLGTFDWQTQVLLRSDCL